MLARLDDIAGVTEARVDRSGVLLRLCASSNAIALVQDELRSAGYDATLSSQPSATTCLAA